MRQDGRLSRILHVLVHMAESSMPLTSEAIAKMLKTNPVVIRRTLGALREYGLVESSKGHGGGWILSKSLDEISYYDVYRALGEPAIFAIGLTKDSPVCLIEKSVNKKLAKSFKAAEDELLVYFKALKLSDIVESVKRNR